MRHQGLTPLRHVFFLSPSGTAYFFRRLIVLVSLACAAQAATAVVLFDNYRGRLSITGTPVSPNYLNQTSSIAALQNLVDISAAGNSTIASSGSAANVDWGASSGALCNTSSAPNSQACLSQLQGRVVYALVKFPIQGSYSFTMAHDDEVKLQFSTNYSAANSANYRGFDYNVPVGSLSAYTRNDSDFAAVPGSFNVAQDGACYAMRLYWNNQGGINHLRLHWIPPNGAEAFIPDVNLRDPSDPASYTDCAIVNSDIGVSKSGPPSFVADSSTSFQYSIKVWNYGPNPASGITVADTLPSSVSVTSATCTATGSATCAASGVSSVGNAYSFKTGSLPLNTTAGNANTPPADGSGSYLTYTVTVVPSSGTTSLSNTATLTVNDSNPANNTSTFSNVVRDNSVRISKTGPTSSPAGQPFNYTVSLVNNRNSVVSPVVVAEQLPANVKVVAVSGATCTPSQPSNPGALLSCTLNSSLAANGGTGSFTLTAVAVSSGNAVNYVATSRNGSSSPGTPGATCPSNSSCANWSTQIIAAPNAALSKSFAPASIPEGGSSTLRVTISNAGSASALTGLAVTDSLPSNVTATTTGTNTCGGSTAIGSGATAVSLANGQLAAGDSCYFEVQVTSSSAASYTNTIGAQALASTEGASNVSPANAVLTVFKAPRLTVAKRLLGQVVSSDQFTVSISNDGPSATTTGSGSGGTIQTPAYAATAGASYVLRDDPAGATSAARYSSSYACVNTTVGGTSVPASGTGTTVSVTPQVGDNITCTFTNTPIYPRLSSAKTASANPFVVGAAGQFYDISVTVANGPTTAPVALADTLPTGITLADLPTISGAATLSGCASSGSSLGASCQLGANLANGTYTVRIPINVSATAVGGGATNTANLSGGGDPNCTAGTQGEACDSSTPPVTVVQKADLSITKTSAQGTSYVPGQTLNYTIVVTNNGPSDVSGATVSDAVPSDVMVSSWNCVPSDASASCGGTSTGTSNSVSLTGVSLPNGKSVTITIAGTAKLSATGNITNSATATLPVGMTCIAAPCSKTSIVTNQNSGAPALSISKQATPTSFAVGQMGVYSIQVTNTGTNSTSGTITVTDTMPAGITVTSVGGTDWTCMIGSGNSSVSCTSNAVLLPGSAAQVINAMVSIANGTATPAENTAKVSGGDTTCTTQAPCEVTIQTNVDRPQLDVTKLLNGSFVVGQQAIYTITATNNGQAATLAGTITDLIPTGLLIGDLTNSGCTASGQTVTCNVPAGKPSGSSVVFTIPVTPQAHVNGQSLTNKAQVNSDTGDSTCPAGTHCTGMTDNPVTAAQLTLTKAASVAAFTVGQQANYQLVLKNSGTADTTAAVTVADTVPAGLQIDESNLAAQNCVVTPAGSQSVACTVDSLPKGATVNIIILVTPQMSVDGQTVKNQATATGGGDPLCGDSTAAASLPARCAPSTSTVVNAPHLKMQKSTDTPTFSVGVLGHYTLQVTNVGTAPTNGTITVVDVIPASLTLGTMPAGCTAQGQQVTCTSTQVLAAPQGAIVGGSVNFNIPVTPKAVVSSSSVSNTATVLGGGDPVCPTNTADCTSTITTNVDAPSLQLAKADNGAWVVGQAGAAYTLTVKNVSAAVATVGAITVVDTLPAGISAMDTTSGNWTCTVSGQTVTCTSSTSLAANGTVAINLPVTVSASAITSGTGGVVKNNASVAGGGDPFNGGIPPTPGSACTALDSALPGHCAGKDTVVNLPAAMAVTKGKPTFFATGTPSQYTATYAVTVVNDGGAPGAYTLIDTPGYPAGVSLDSWTVVSANGTVNPTLAAKPSNGAGNQISVANTSINSGSTHTYTVAITFTTNVDVTAMSCTGAPGYGAYNAVGIGNGSTAANCESLPGVPNLVLAKTSNGPWVVEQTGARYVLTVSNSGTAATTGTITVSDYMPGGVIVASGMYNGWSCVASGPLLTCTNPTAIAASGSASINVPVAIAAAAVPSVTNSASVGGGGDPYNGGNPPMPGNCAGDAHCASTSTDVLTKAALEVTKTNGVSKVVAATTTTYIVTITNNGGTDATDLSWTDTIVSGLDKVSVEAGPFTAGSVVGTCQALSCTGITVRAGGSVSYKVTAKVVGSVGTKAVNSASVTGGACTTIACTSTDSDDIDSPVDVTPVPVNSSKMLLMLGTLLLLAVVVRQRWTSRDR
ncbi:DUF11 domain-containing protein [Diaphorobacter sp. HDW4B]|uniref:DUF7933 domain-containing protein n=1 Tax=Diaphorobacter sp. HDW4B TaxID=2714925 RepID=UPI00140BACA1|nr:DUF11 domain-containing protein [Diaphorobacter sp. HDW4B]QIL73203.1 DUF11 domain-containing protein [Diaphorobacter sp. HDW4B]